MKERFSKPLRLALWPFLLVALLGCGKSSSKKTPDDGSISGQIYSNAFFGFSWRIPDGWTVANREQLEATQQSGRRLLSGGDKKTENTLRAAEQNTYQLLMTTEKPIGAPVDINPGVIIMAEKVTHMPGIKSGEDYLFHVKKLLSSGQIPATISNEVRKCEIGTRSFHRLDVAIAMPVATVHQAYLTTIVDGYALGFIVTDSAVPDLVPTALKTLQFANVQKAAR